MTHKEKMQMKAQKRAERYEEQIGVPNYIIPANINRRTGEPHEHKREIARRLKRGY